LPFTLAPFINLVLFLPNANKRRLLCPSQVLKVVFVGRVSHASNIEDQQRSRLCAEMKSFKLTYPHFCTGAKCESGMIGAKEA
jgi:hypothetical protein